jgi:pimeloyl-ACP methyl ester carboxylesterase
VHCSHQGRGEAILFIHGMPTSHALWDGVIRQLAGQHRCFAVDLPGMGDTPFLPYGPDYLDRMAERIEQLRIQHGVKKWHVVGHDAGSAVAVQYAGRFSRHVACLALLSPAIFPELKPFYLLNPLRRRYLGEVIAPLLHFIFWQIAMRRAVAGASNSAALRAFYQPFSGPTGAWRTMRLVRWGRPEDMLGKIPAILSELPMPSLIFHGSRDVLPAAFADRAAHLIPNASLITVDAGHFLPLEKPGDVAQGLRTFFAENRATIAFPVPAQRSRKQSVKARTTAATAINLPTHQSVASV